MTDAPVDVHPVVKETADRIAAMEVRGAAAIADEAAVALRTQAESSDATTADELDAELKAAARYLRDTRPTAVSLPNALRYVFQNTSGRTVEERRERAIASVDAFREGLEHAQEKLGRVGANRLRDGDCVMFHCHSTDALACVKAAVEQGKHVEAVVKETRPRMQGHITARQLRTWDVPVTLIVDSGARRYLDDADHVLVGADSITADGSVINKVGTAGLAVSARERGVPIMVAAQTIKLHPDTMTGHTVEIEMRDEQEVLSENARAGISGPGDDDLAVENPAFDVTPPRYVDAIVTERGQYPPESVVVLIRELFGEHTGTEPWEEP